MKPTAAKGHMPFFPGRNMAVVWAEQQAAGRTTRLSGYEDRPARNVSLFPRYNDYGREVE